MLDKIANSFPHNLQTVPSTKLIYCIAALLKQTATKNCINIKTSIKVGVNEYVKMNITK